MVPGQKDTLRRKQTTSILLENPMDESTAGYSSECQRVGEESTREHMDTGTQAWVI